MYQLPAVIWNEIAEAQEPKHKWARKTFRMTADEQDRLMQEQAEKMTKAGEENSVILAYQKIAPLLAEHEAIQTYLKTTDRMGMRDALPIVESAAEAAILGAREHMLNDEQTSRLRTLLQPLEN